MVKGLRIPNDDYRELSATFGSTLRDKAMILETLILLEDTGRTKPLFEELSAALSTDEWLSTQETAYALIAIVPYIQGFNSPGPLTIECTLGGQNQAVTFDTPAAQADMGIFPGVSGAFTIRNRSGASVYARITAKGLPAEGSEPALSEGLALTAEYRNMAGQVINPDDLKPGSDMEVRVTVRNSFAQVVPEVALVHPIPASWEIINFRLAEDGAASVSSGDKYRDFYKYQDVRDDRVMTYFDLDRGAEKTVSFRVNKTYGGRYFRPAVHAYAMYDESIRALIPGVR
jgi:uncharacterized protein YfaS (alpha-2-macroglobulin family)